MKKTLKQKTANILLHHSPYYRLHVFSEGLRKNGFTVITSKTYKPTSDDVLLIWNRNAPHERIAKLYEGAGATVLVTENGYIGKTKALAKWHHSGAGDWYVGGEDRWSRVGIDVSSWREDGDHILVLPQRSIGELGVAMPRNWENNILPRLKKLTNRPIRLRKHPGKNPAISLEEDLKNAWAAVVWASGAGIKAICAGIPVFYDYSKWIGADAGTCTFEIEKPYLGDRKKMLHKLAWAQWNWSEIESGEAFRCLL